MKDLQVVNRKECKFMEMKENGEQERQKKIGKLYMYIPMFFNPNYEFFDKNYYICKKLEGGIQNSIIMI